ncbi:MAG: hypothetical protein Q4B50_08250, partial [Bacillota bacterium]|nr:hypothetical protein [Bacillota bacterium]
MEENRFLQRGPGRERACRLLFSVLAVLLVCASLLRESSLEPTLQAEELRLSGAEQAEAALISGEATQLPAGA